MLALLYALFICIVQLVFAISASFPQVPLTEVIATCSSSMDVPNESIVTGTGIEHQMLPL